MEERTSPAKTEPAEDLRDMKAIFASLNLEDGNARVPSPTQKEKNASADLSLAQHQESYVNHRQVKDLGPHAGQDDSYQLGFDDGQGYWDDGQGGRTYGIPRPPEYR